MKAFRLLKLIVVPLTMLAASSALATNNLPPIAPFPDVVYLRQNCGMMQNCATTMAEVLTWTYNTRLPSASFPLLIDIGTGSFGGFTCNASGYITLRGAGRHNTVLGFTIVGLNLAGPGCTRLAFQDLSIVGGDRGFEWWGGGSASYSNIEITGGQYAWWDYSSGGSQHYWWNSVLNSTSSGTATFQTYGATHRFYGGEVNLNATGGSLGYPAAAVWVNDSGGVSGEIQMYGSAIRARASPGAIVVALAGVRVGFNQTFHLHGGSIGVNASAAGDANVNVEGIRSVYDSDSGTGSTVHVLESAYALTGKGSGTVRRISSPPGVGVAAPFLWSNGPNAPPITSSQKGADMYVETDCSAAKCSGAATADGTETHLMIYNSSCATDGPWFDVVTGRCRGL